MYRQEVIYVLEIGFTFPKNTRILLLFKFKIYAKLLTFTCSFLVFFSNSHKSYHVDNLEGCAYYYKYIRMYL